MIHHREAAWEMQMPELVDAYMRWKHSSPNIENSNDKFSVAILGLDCAFYFFSHLR